jgi:hypothetical protein
MNSSESPSSKPVGLGSSDFDHEVGLSALSDPKDPFPKPFAHSPESSDFRYSLVFDPGQPSPSEFERPIFQHFSKKPYHIWHLRSPINAGRFMKDYSSRLMRSEIGWNGKGPQEVYRLLFRLQTDVFIYIEAWHLTVYASKREQIADLRDSLLRYVVRDLEDSPKFMLIDVHGGGAYANRVQLNHIAQVRSEDLAMLYGHEFPEWERLWLERMSRRLTGLSILSGPTGTGKTTYLRSLVDRLAGSNTHCFYYIPTSFAAVLTSPEYVNFWVTQNQCQKDRKKVVILEDAEDLLLKRNESSCTRVSNLLNVTDGFLSDQLRLQVIATVNCHFEELDPAIARPGRLIGYRHFRRLDRQEAEILASSRGINLQDQVDYSLAEIFSSDTMPPVTSRQPKLGFAQ